jgi:hypothetical protein
METGKKAADAAACNSNANTNAIQDYVDKLNRLFPKSLLNCEFVNAVRTLAGCPVFPDAVLQRLAQLKAYRTQVRALLKNPGIEQRTEA